MSTPKTHTVYSYDPRTELNEVSTTEQEAHIESRRQTLKPSNFYARQQHEDAQEELEQWLKGIK